jgi:hypothetical protein
MVEQIEQALFGYSQGHRLIASSTDLDRESSRVLRSVTDMRFGERSRSLLTVLPLPRMTCHAFIKTWPASAGMRPGSVWSHVLLVPHVVLDDVASIRSIQSLFVQPAAQMEERAELFDSYTTNIQPDRARGAVATPHPQVTQPELEKLISAAYGHSGPVEVVVRVAEVFDDVILGLMDQQWASLRRRFTARTRFRGSTSTVAEFDISVVERPSGRTARVKPREQRWVKILSEDLIAPDPSVRNMLREFGPETPRGREDVPALVTIFAAAESKRVQAAVDIVSKRFRVPAQMPALKQALFGPNDAARAPIGQWPEDDRSRLTALLSVEPSALDYAQMQVAERLLAAPNPADLAAGVQWNGMDASTRMHLVRDLSRLASREVIVEIALATPVATELLSPRPDAWADETLWLPSHVDVVHGLLDSADREARSVTLQRLVSRHDLRAATYVNGLDPKLWWGLVDAEPNAAALLDDPEAARTARRLVEEFGSERIGSPDRRLTTNTHLRALNLAAPADSHLWRAVAPSQWLDLGIEVIDETASMHALDRDEFCQLLIVVLAAGHEDGDTAFRERAWRTTFGQLHNLLVEAEPPDGATWTLDTLLPRGGAWDWSRRLREGLALAAVTGDWQTETVDQIASNVPSFAPEIEERVAEIRERKRQSLLEAIVRFFFPHE